ncbi:transporter substrate-binding domain-containing protein [Bartonella sp. DGB2]|uniref:transporter substrate-binding domain-containing protein n=1 Tax=Bartonella sp. DGB2 TaxID=3388426 RepID=UPI00398FC121
MKRKIQMSAVGACLLALTTISKAEIIRFASEGAYPPFDMIDSNGQLYGFEIELVKAMCDEMKADCPFIAQDWEGLMPGLLANKYDAVIAGISVTPEREAVIDFAAPYQTTYNAFAVRKDSPINDMSPQSFAGKIIATQASAAQAIYAEDVYVAAGAQVRLYATAQEANRDLANHRVDAVTNNNLPLLEWLNTDGRDCCRYLGKLDSTATTMAIAVRKKSNSLKDRLNKALESIKRNGTYDKLIKKYFKYTDE